MATRMGTAALVSMGADEAATQPFAIVGGVFGMAGTLPRPGS